MDETKNCTRCGMDKPLDAFHRSKKTKSGRVANCIECRKAEYRARPLIEPAMTGEQRCWECGEVKHVTAFPRHKREANGRHGLCKMCHSTRERERRERNPEEFLERRRTAGKAWELNRRYGLTMERYAEMAAIQGGGCAICGTTADQQGQHLCVDHDHRCCPERKTSCGKCIRGLLCTSCNRALGWLRDDPDLVERALAYLRSYC